MDAIMLVSDQHITIGGDLIPAVIRLRADDDPGAEWPQVVRDERIAAGAATRYASRVGATLRAAALSLDSESEGWSLGGARTLRALIEMDLGGVGGSRGLGGHATTRMPWARGLGAGRRHARDGGAWRSAAEAASARLSQAIRAADPEDRGVTPEDARECALLLTGEALRWAVVYAVRRAVAARDPAEAHRWAGAARTALADEECPDREVWAARIGMTLE